MAGLAEPAGQQCVVIEWFDLRCRQPDQERRRYAHLERRQCADRQFQPGRGRVGLGRGRQPVAHRCGHGRRRYHPTCRRPPTRPSVRWRASAVRSTWAAARSPRGAGRYQLQRHVRRRHGGLVKLGTGVQTLSGVNNLSGGVALNAGGLLLGNAAALGSGALSVGGNVTLDGTTGPFALANAVNLVRAPASICLADRRSRSTA